MPGVWCGGAQVTGKKEHQDVEELEKPRGQLWQGEKIRIHHYHVSPTTKVIFTIYFPKLNFAVQFAST